MLKHLNGESLRIELSGRKDLQLVLDTERNPLYARPQFSKLITGRKIDGYEKR
ncbi:hypothetical protein ACDZ28_18450 [Paenibacillus sp. RS8]|uniref:hypothetical protein n=1 Tax=Paenibacillus TaxID=44249 RepID=UPI0012E067BB|nr:MULTISPECIES: hypothetical protein [Paenibacillus]